MFFSPAILLLGHQPKEIIKCYQTFMPSNYKTNLKFPNKETVNKIMENLNPVDNAVIECNMYTSFK